MCKIVSETVDWDLHVLTINRNSAGFHSIEEFLEEDDGFGKNFENILKYLALRPTMNSKDTIWGYLQLLSECPELLITENCPAVILCTSGTTGIMF